MVSADQLFRKLPDITSKDQSAFSIIQHHPSEQLISQVAYFGLNQTIFNRESSLRSNRQKTYV